MDAPTLPISVERNLRDPIEIRVDIVHPAPVDVFPAAIVVRTLAQYGEAIRGEKGSYRVGATVDFYSGGPSTRLRELQEAPGVYDQSAQTSLIDTLF
ncbi:hypothetical protein Tco_1007728 [Tanacetum coccineum]